MMQRKSLRLLVSLFIVALFIVTSFAGCGAPGPVTIPAAGPLKKIGPGVHKHTVNIPGVGSLKYTIDIPANYDGKTPVPLVLALHYGYEGSKPDSYTGEGMIEAFGPGLADLNAIVIAPDALGGSWTSAKNEKAAVWLTKSAMETYAIDKKKVVLTGYSLGGEGTWYIGSRHQDLFTGAIPVAAPLANTSASWSIPVFVIHSHRDEVVSFTSSKKYADALKAKGTKIEFKNASGLSHYKTDAYGPHVGDAVKWLQTQWK